MPTGIYKRTSENLQSLREKNKTRIGKKLSENWKRKISEGHKGIKPSLETRKKLSEIHKLKPNRYWLGKKRPDFAKWLTGRKFSEETKRKLSESHIGLQAKEKHPLWLGGISFNPYPREFNTKLKLKIRTRDNFICCLCGKTEREELEELNRVLCVNHIDFNKNNCKENNLNTLCQRCNIKICRQREFWTNYFNQK